MKGSSLDVALLKWSDEPGFFEEAIEHELRRLGQRIVYFRYDQRVPDGVDVVVSFAAYREILQVPRQLQDRPAARRPIFVHWNTEGLVNPRVPYPIARLAAELRARIARLPASRSRALRRLAASPAFAAANRRMRGLVRLGDILAMHRLGWLDVYAEVSAIVARRLARHGIPVVHAPFGSSPVWYEELRRPRDIDVFWMGMRGTRRRDRVLARVQRALEERGVRVHMADGVQHPFVFGRERTELLNRSKITLNVVREWWSDNSLRFAKAAPNRSLFVSEHILPHSPKLVAGTHYVSVPVERLPEAILHHLGDDGARQRIVEAAYRLATEDLTFAASFAAIWERVERVRHERLRDA